MLKHLRSEFRYHLQYPTEYRFGLMKASLRQALNSGTRTIRFLIVSDGGSGTSEQQFAPLWRHATLLRNRLGVVLHRMRLSDGLRLGRTALSRFHAVGLKLLFRTPTHEAERIVSHFRERTLETGTRLVYFDGDDDVCVQWPEVLREVDLYVKKGVFKSDENYFRTFAGKNNLTDYVSRTYDIPVPADIPESGTLQPGDLVKLHLGWSIAMDDKIAGLFENTKPPDRSAKELDVVCRTTIRSDWTLSLRTAMIPRLEPLKTRYRILLPTAKVPPAQYYEEMRRSRICVSPLGYGEVCWRDYEAILCGCLLVKPELSHLHSHPDVFVPGVTYVPVRWDYADLAEICEYYLDREEERARIAANAYRVLADASGAEAFVEMFAGVLERLGLGSAGRASPAVCSGESNPMRIDESGTSSSRSRPV